MSEIKQIKKKKSLAKTLSTRVLIIMLISVTILYGIMSVLIYNDENEKKEKYARAIVSLYADTILYFHGINDIPLDVKHADTAVMFGSYICKWYDIDYISVYIPDIKNNTITFLSAAESEKHENKTLDSFLTGETYKYELSEEEKKVWEGKQMFAYTEKTYKLGHIKSCTLRSVDTFGNKVIVSVDFDISRINFDYFLSAITVFIIILIVLFGIYLSLYLSIRKKVYKPAKDIQDTIEHFVADDKNSYIKLNEDYDGEFGMIAKSFNEVAKRTGNYLDNIENLSREQERNETERNIAGKIQLNFLNKDTLISSRYIIDAYIKPAKNIGGDLYDYMKLKDGSLLLVIADVSGKGITAAVAMMSLLSYIKHCALIDMSPSQILEETNQMFSTNNTEMMFATVFLGIYNPKTKKLTYANAGHNHPYLIKGNNVTEISGECGTVIGLYKKEKYPENIIDIENKDIIFMYTDGVTEAVNKEKKFFKEERLINALSTFIGSGEAKITTHVNKYLEEFSKGAEQHDDITMIAARFSDFLDINLYYEISEFQHVKEAIMNLDIDKKDQLDLCVASEECFANICNYSHPEGTTHDDIVRFRIYDDDDKVKIIFIDDGIPFNPTENIVDIDEYDIDNDIGGLGNFIAMSSVDKTEYEYKDNKNILTLIKYLKGHKNNGDK